jgi:hypothetical protein
MFSGRLWNLFATVSFLLFVSHAPTLQAQTRQEVVLWESIKDSQDPNEFKAYLNQYPNGTFASVARVKIDELTQKQVDKLSDTTWNVHNHWVDGWGRESWFNGVINFGVDGSCSGSIANGWDYCKWMKQGRGVTISLSQQNNKCPLTFSLVLTKTTMFGGSPDSGKCFVAQTSTLEITGSDDDVDDTSWSGQLTAANGAVSQISLTFARGGACSGISSAGQSCSWTKLDKDVIALTDATKDWCPERLDLTLSEGGWMSGTLTSPAFKFKKCQSSQWKVSVSRVRNGRSF